MLYISAPNDHGTAFLLIAFVMIAAVLLVDICFTLEDSYLLFESQSTNGCLCGIVDVFALDHVLIVNLRFERGLALFLHKFLLLLQELSLLSQFRFLIQSVTALQLLFFRQFLYNSHI